MAIVNVSLDTSNRQVVLTVNGILVPTTDCILERYEYDGEAHVRFAYTVESVDGNGLKERRRFYLPSPEEAAALASAELDEDGFASKTVHDDERAKADTIDFLKHKRNSR